MRTRNATKNGKEERLWKKTMLQNLAENGNRSIGNTSCTIHKYSGIGGGEKKAGKKDGIQTNRVVGGVLALSHGISGSVFSPEKSC